MKEESTVFKGLFNTGDKTPELQEDASLYGVVLRELRENANQDLTQFRRRYGLDGATQYFYLRMLGTHRLKAFRGLIHQRKQDFSNDLQDIPVLIVMPPKVLWDAGTPKMEKQMRTIAMDAGFRDVQTFAPQASSVIEGALALRKEVLDFQRRGKKIFLLSFGHGSAYCRFAMDQSKREELSHVLGWVNLSGLVFGSPRYGLETQKKWYLRKERACASSFSCEQKYFIRPVTENIPGVVSFLGCRLSGTMGRAERKQFQGLRHWGPNDGWLSFRDYEKMPGFVVPLWGQGHNINCLSESRLLQKTMCYLVELSQMQKTKNWSLRNLDFVIPSRAEEALVAEEPPPVQI